MKVRIINNKKGFTLVEIIVVLVILAVLAAFILPTMLGFVSGSKEKLCDVSRMDMTRLYKTARLEPQATLSDDDFEAFIIANWGSLNQCPSGGDYTYNASRDNTSGNPVVTITCSIHGSAHVITADEVNLPDTTTESDWDYGFLGRWQQYTGTATDIIIPKKIDGITIKKIWQNTFANKDLTKLAFGEDSEIIHIHGHAFKNNNLTEIDLPPTLINLDNRAFYDNPITKITIGTGVIIENNSVFQNNGSQFKSLYNDASGGAGTYVYNGTVWEKQP